MDITARDKADHGNLQLDGVPNREMTYAHWLIAVWYPPLTPIATLRLRDSSPYHTLFRDEVSGLSAHQLPQVAPAIVIIGRFPWFRG
jgi:hypothetical protein